MKPTCTIHFAILFVLTSICASVFAQNVTVNSSQLTGGLSASPLVGGTTGAAIFGFTLDKAGGGTNTVTSITISFTQDPSIRFSSAELYSSSDNTFGVGDVSVASGTLNSTSIVFTGAPITNFGNANGNTSANFFLVVTVSPSVTGVTAATTPSLTGANVTTSPAATGSVTGNSYSFASLAATITGTGSTRNMVAGSSAQTLATFTAASTGTAQTLSQIDFVFSVDIASIFNTFTLNNGSADVGTPSYTAGTKTLTFTAIGDPLTTAPLSYTLKANVASGAGTSSQTVALSNSGVTVTGGGIVNAFTTITNTLNVTALAATISGTGATRNMVAGSTTQTLATFSTVSTGSTQTLSQVDFVFSVDIASIFNTFTLNNGSSNVGTPTYTAGTKTLSFASIGDAITTSTTSYTLRANVAGAAGPSSQTVALSNAGISVSGGGSVNGFSTITNTLNVTYSQSSIIELNGGVTNPINFAEYNKQTTSGLTTGNSTSLAQFRIRDGGLSNNDTDSQPTTLDALTLSITNFANLRTIALFDGSSIVPGTEQSVSTGTVVFSGPLGLVVNDDANKSFSVRATFKANVTDNQFIQVTIANATANSGGSLFSSSNAGGAQTDGGTDNQIQVVATQINVVSGPTPSAPFINSNFSLSVNAIDANGNVDTNRTNNVTVSVTTGPSGGNTSSATGLSQPMAAGTYSWSDLRLNKAGAYQLSVAYSGITPATVNMSAQSVGVTVTAASPMNVCYNGSFQPLVGGIKVAESDQADFGAGVNQIFMLELPAGFVFNTTITTPPSFTAGRNMSNVSSLSYIGNTVVRFSYDVTGTDKTDDFTINNLQVKYVNGPPPTTFTGNILVLDASAVINGNSAADNKNHGTLSVGPSPTAVSFSVQELPTFPAVNPSQITFNSSSNDVRLNGSPLGGVFSGNGVSFATNASGTGYTGYIFSPSAVGTGTSTIVYKVKDTGGQQCDLYATNLFTVTGGVFNNLLTKYCSNQSPTLNCFASNTQISNDWGPGYAIYDYVYYDYDINNNNTFVTGWVPFVPPNTTNFTFDPKNPTFIAAINKRNAYFQNFFSFTPSPPGVYIGYRVQTSSGNILQISPRNYEFVTINSTPVVSFSIVKNSFCTYDSPVSLIGSPSGNNPLVDKFTGSSGIGTSISNSGNNWTFTPSQIGTTNASISITYSYTDPSSSCSNTFSQNVIVYTRPSVVPNADITVNSVASLTTTACQGINPKTFDTNVFAAPQYNWYSDVALTNRVYIGNNFQPPININAVGSTSFYLTRVINGCESLGKTLNAVITQPVTTVAGISTTICSGSFVDLTTIGATITGGATDGTWSVLSPPGGQFQNSSSAPDANFTTSVKFIPAASQLPPINSAIPTTIKLQLTSDVPALPNVCPSTNNSVLITVNPAALANAGLDQTVCSGNTIILSGSVGQGASIGTWSDGGRGGSFGNASAFNTIYFPTAGDLASGATFPITLTTNDPAGPCNAINDQMILTINQKPTVNAGSVAPICADQDVALTGTFGGGASSATWTTPDGTGTGLPFTSSTFPVNATYILSSAEKSASNSVITRQFVLTTNDPDGPSGPCTAVSSNPVVVVINPIPTTPTISGQNVYCAGDVIQGIRTTGSPSSTITWYLDAGLTAIAATSAPNAGSYLFTPVVTSTEQVTAYYATQKIGTCESKGQVAGTSPAVFTLTINPKPSATFSATNLCLGPTDQVQFDASGSSISTAVFPGATIAGYKWQFGDLTSSDFSLSNKIISHRYPFASTFEAILTVTSDKNCSTDIKSSEVIGGVNPLLIQGSQIRIGNYPIPSINFSKQCFGDQTLIEGLDNSLNLNNDKKDNLWKWDLGDGTIQNTLSLNPTNPNKTSLTHQYASIGVKPVVLTITSNLGCVASNVVPVNLPILPYISPTQNASYVESFELTNGGWVPDGFNQNPVTLAVTNTSSWRRTSAFGASAGSEAWITNVDIGGGNFTYYPNERSVLYGPCFNIKNNLTKPVFSIDYLKDLEAGNDGAYIEVSIDDGATWSVLGNLSQGLEWYDQGGLSGVSISPPITNLIGQTVGQFGWTGRSNTWKTGKFQLDSYLNETRLRVRVVFGSNGNNPANFNGFALDNIKVENRNRVLLAEAFTNLSASGATVRNTDFKNFVSNNPELVKIQYHTNFGGTDVNNGYNPADPQARAIFYGVATPFRGFLDGFSTGNGLITTTNNSNPPSNDWSVNYYGRRSLAAAPLDISINTTNNATDVTINATIQILSADLPPSLAGSPRYFAFLAIVEQVNGEFIFRKFLPNASGTPLTKIKATQTQTITGQWQTSAPYDPNNLYVICFVQDIEGTQAGIKEVLQSGIAKLPVTSVVTGFEPPVFANLSFYPIPADKELIVSLPEVATQNTPLVMYDAVGKSVHQTAIDKGQQSKTISTQELAPGVYLIQLETDKGIVRKKVMVVH